MCDSTVAQSKTKTCRICGVEKPATTAHFYFRTDNNCFRNECIECGREQKKRYRENNHEAIREMKRRYYQENIDKISEKKRKAYYSNIEKQRERKRTYYYANIEKLRAYSRNWQRENQEKAREKQRKWKLNNPDRRRAHARAYANNRRARILFVGGTHTAEDARAQYDSQKGRCWWCGKKVGKKYEIDHRIPIARGGSNAPDNLVISCPDCNRSKGAKLPHEWSDRLL